MVEAVARASLETTFDVIVPIDLSRVFHKHGPLPGVNGTRGAEGAWDHVGASRVVELSDGSEAPETITAYERPGYFGYTVGPFESAPLRWLVDVALGEFWFIAGDDATAIRWSYTFVPKSSIRKPLVRLVVGTLWRGYAKRTLERMVVEVERAA